MAFADTSQQSEGSTPLKQFFDTNGKLKIEWYNKLLEEDIDYDDLMEGSEKILTKMLEDCELKGKAILRIVAAVSKVTESRIYKDLNSTKVSVISTEESDAIDSVQTAGNQLNNVIENITNIMKSLNENSQLSEKIINDNCDKIIQIVNKRREELLNILSKIKETKNNKLLNQQNILKIQSDELNIFYNKTQSMIKDTTMDKQKRKIKILAETKQILNKRNDNDLMLITNDKINITMNINEISNLLSIFGNIFDGNGAMPPIINIKSITHNSAKLNIRNNEDEKECFEYKLEYINSNNNLNEIETDEKLEWNSISIENKNNMENIEYEIKSLNKSSKYVVRAAAKNKNGFGVYSKYAMFTTQNISPMELNQLIASQMIFDSYGMNTSRMQIINDKQVKCLKGQNEDNSTKGSSIRFKFGMPISAQGNNKYNITSISWEVTHTATHFPNGYYFIGVVSNRATDFSNGAWKGELTDAYGVGGFSAYTYKAGKYVGESHSEYPRNAIVKVEYRVNELKLIFTYGNGTKFYEMKLPNNNNITHWYPCITLRDKNDICKILNVTVK